MKTKQTQPKKKKKKTIVLPHQCITGLQGKFVFKDDRYIFLPSQDIPQTAAWEKPISWEIFWKISAWR